jgi:hypothetical protein
VSSDAHSLANRRQEIALLMEPDRFGDLLLIQSSRAALRGEVVKDAGNGRKAEPTEFRGRHYVEVCIVQDSICIAQDRHPVIIK